MPITIHCPHCNTELQLKEENKGPEGLLECPKCKCTFRVCLATFNRECFAKIHPKTEWKSDKKIQMEIGETLEKRKRGRPKKNEKIIEKEIDKEQQIRQDKNEPEPEWQGGPMQEVPEEEKENAS
jgi:phosphorylcholine metabolism protein LicD